MLSLLAPAVRRGSALRLGAPRLAPLVRCFAANGAVDRERYDPRGAEPCRATIYSFGPLGASVDVAFPDGRAGVGMILQSELRFLREARRGDEALAGETLDAFAVSSRDDGRLDVTLRPATAKGKSDDAATAILAALEIHGGSLPIGDKSSPADIAEVLPGISKSVFKNAVGSLYRAGRVEPDRLETRAAAAAAAPPPPRSRAAAPKGKGAAPPAGQSPVLFVANLPFGANWPDLRTALDLTTKTPLSGGGLRRKRDGSASGCAHVEYGTAEEAEAALLALDGANVYGRTLRVEWAQEKKGTARGGHKKRGR